MYKRRQRRSKKADGNNAAHNTCNFIELLIDEPVGTGYRSKYQIQLTCYVYHFLGLVLQVVGEYDNPDKKG